MTCHPPQLPQPSQTFLTFCSWHGLVGCNLFTLGSLGCCFEREKTGTSFSQILRPINILSFCHPIPKGLTQNSPYLIPDPTTKALATCTPSKPTSFTQQNSNPNHLPPHPFQRRPTDDISSQDKSPKAPTGLMKCSPCTQPHVLFKSFLHKAKATSPHHPSLLLSKLHSWHIPN